MRKVYLTMIIAMLQFVVLKAGAYENNTGKLRNLVCFVRFADEDATVFQNEITTYQSLFNDTKDDANSVYNYFKKASYGKLEWGSSFFPLASENKIVSYCTQYERGFYMKKGSINTSGYEDDTTKTAREQALIKEIAAYLSTNIPDSIALDANNDGLVDNICLIFSGQSEISNKYLLWPHRSDLALPDEKAIYIKGKKVVSYLMVFDGANGFDSQFAGISLNTGVICHEMSHSLGTYDLYHTSSDLSPVGIWDLMSDNQVVAQNMTAYTKYRYCKWIGDIPEITEAGTYTLNPIGGTSTDKLAYKIKPVGSDEYFIVEYRKKEGFDSTLPQSGLIVYRINPQYTGGNVTYNGTTRLDEEYIFRPGGTTKSDGDITKAAFSAESGRTVFGGIADEKPFYSDGKTANFSISHVSSCGETLSFYLEPMSKQVILSDSVVKINGSASSGATMTIAANESWTITGAPDWLTLTPMTGISGSTTVSIAANSDNTSNQTREATLTVTGSTSGAVTFKVAQISNVIAPPSGLSLKKDDAGIHLTWNAVESGKSILFENFENTENPNGWVMKNTGDRGWHWQAATKYYKAYEGNYSATMWEAWDDIHQDEYLTSPTFSNGKSLSFYSRTTAAGTTPKDPQYYYVEVSKDDGVTWTHIFNANTDCDKSLSGKYTKITLDLSSYMSDKMKIRFHCYDTSNVGLSYYWQIDDVDIYSASSTVQVTGYNIYRNGVLIGTSDQTSFVDSTPASGMSAYTVSAKGDFGESSVSDAVVYNQTSGIPALNASPSSDYNVYSISGLYLGKNLMPQTKGVYILRSVHAGNVVVKKITIK